MAYENNMTAVMSSHIEVPARRYRIRFMSIISCGWLINQYMQYTAQFWRDERWYSWRTSCYLQ